MLIGAIDIGGTNTKTAIINEAGEILSSETFSSPHGADWEQHFSLCVDAFKRSKKTYERMIDKTLFLDKNFLGVGINLPGMVNPEEGKLIYAPYQNWKDVPVKRYFSEELNFEKVHIENDINACAIGELIFGKGYRNFAWVTLSTGNGGAIVIDGKLVSGNNFCGGEIGHLKVEFDDPRKCSCGQFGCLEAYASSVAMEQIYRENTGNKLDALGISKLAYKGDKEAIKTYAQAGKYLGRAFSNIVNILDPEILLLGGGISESLKLLLPTLEEEIKRNTITEGKSLKIQRSEQGYYAALLGAGAVVLYDKI